MRKIILIVFLFIIFSLLVSQTPQWEWATGAGGIDSERGNAITIDNDGNSYVTGQFYDTVTFGSYSLTSSGLYDIFVAKIDSTGTWLWATQAGGSNSDGGWEKGVGIIIDDSANCYVIGYFSDTATFGSYSLISSGFEDIFVAKINENGAWLWASQAGGSLEDGGEGISIDNDRNIYVTGSFKNTATFGSYSLISSGLHDIFVAKINENGTWL